MRFTREEVKYTLLTALTMVAYVVLGPLVGQWLGL